MYDIHCHVLSAIDDGAKDVNDTLEICKNEETQGVKAIVATPHYIDEECEYEIPDMLSQISMVNQQLKDKNIKITVLPGMEIYISYNLVELYESGKIITLNNKNHMLIELPLYDNMPPYLDDVLFKLRMKDIYPIIAHPERCKYIIEYPNSVYKLIEKGCLIQVNSGSVQGLFGKTVQKTANKLLSHNMVHAIATDNHSIHKRMSSLEECFNIVSKRFGNQYAEDLFINNVSDIIIGNNINVNDPDMIKDKKWLFF